LKKYSPIGELSEFAARYAQSLAQAVEALVCITDRDYVIAAAGAGRKEVEGEHLSDTVEHLMEKRGTYTTAEADKQLPIVTKEWKNDHRGGVLSSIFSNGDCQGSVIMLEKSGDLTRLETLKTLASAAADFLGRNMEQ
jgi:AbrB family transcriptional regulator (stage V sporulation protein T)